MKYFLLAIVLIEIWYWFFYFPKAWKDESNSEINAIKRLLEKD